MVQKHELFLALADENGAARGGVWRITAKKTDFYLDLIGAQYGGLHLSVHAPNERFEKHRFHIKTDRRKAPQAREKGVYLEKALDKGKGVEIPGLQLAEHAYHVARLRRTWDLQRPRYRHAALTRTRLPQTDASKDGRVLETQMGPNYAWDIDLVISYDRPHWIADTFWSKQKQITPHSPRIGPLRNSAGMYLTATSIHHSLLTHPSPTQHLLPRPKHDKDAQAVTLGGFGEGDLKDVYWFEERVVSKDFIQKYDFAREKGI